MTSASDAAPCRRRTDTSNKMADPSFGTKWWITVTGMPSKFLARPTSRCILFDGENISFDASLVIYIYIYK